LGCGGGAKFAGRGAAIYTAGTSESRFLLALA
jgi:hypothetical protein